VRGAGLEEGIGRERKTRGVVASMTRGRAARKNRLYFILSWAGDRKGRLERGGKGGQERRGVSIRATMRRRQTWKDIPFKWESSPPPNRERERGGKK